MNCSSTSLRCESKLFIIYFRAATISRTREPREAPREIHEMRDRLCVSRDRFSIFYSFFETNFNKKPKFWSFWSKNTPYETHEISRDISREFDETRTRRGTQNPISFHPWYEIEEINIYISNLCHVVFYSCSMIVNILRVYFLILLSKCKSFVSMIRRFWFQNM